MDIIDIVFGFLVLTLSLVVVFNIVFLFASILKGVNTGGNIPSQTNRDDNTLKEINDTITRNRYDSMTRPEHYGQNKK